MPSLKELKNRIRAIKSTQKITQAMKMVAASKLNMINEKIATFKPYAQKVSELTNILTYIDSKTTNKLLLNTRNDIHLLIVSTADRGLCGTFNSNIIKKVKSDITILQSLGKKVKIICIGIKGYDILKKPYHSEIIAHFKGFGGGAPNFQEILVILADILEKFENNEFDICTIYYSKFISVINQKPYSKQIIPFTQDETSIDIKQEYEFEPEPFRILDDLLPKNIAAQIYEALLENAASENGARMTAMENATRNSGEVVKGLQLLYNRTRQAYITKELIEIISGAEAV